MWGLSNMVTTLCLGVRFNDTLVLFGMTVNKNH